MTLPEPKPGILSISPYKAGKSSKKPGGEPIKLSSNENPYGASPLAVAAYEKAVSSLNRYPNAGCSGIRAAIAERHDILAKNIICGAGSDELLGMLVHAFAGDGDEVLYSEHGFLMYKIYTLANGATPVEAPESKLKTDVDSLLAKVTERTKIVFIANPNNPTGSYIPASEIKRLRDGLPENVILGLDAAYAEYVEKDDYDAGLKLALETDNTVMFRTFSKIYGMPALRLGWLVASDYIIDILGRIRSPFNVTSAAQQAGMAAVKDQKWLAEQIKLNKEGMDFLRSEFESLGFGVYESHCNFLLIEFGDTKRADKILKSLAKRDIYVRDVMAYKLPTCLRISIGTREENEALVAACKDIVLNEL